MRRLEEVATPSPKMDGKYFNLWSTDNDRTDANDDVVIKSVYDPSPVGYSLPASNAFTGFTTTGGNVGAAHTPLTPEQRAQLNVKGNFDKGWDFYTKPDKQHTTFFPASGFRNHSSGSLLSVFIYGYYLTSGSFEHIREWILHFDSGFVFPLNYDHQRSFGFPVRSAEEKKWKYVCCSKLQMVFGLREVYDA